MPASLPTVPVLCTAQDQTGAPLAGGRFEATLDRVEHYGGFVVPQVVAGVADAAGNCTLELWPNVLGSQGSTYRVRAWHGVTGVRYLDAWAAVPDQPCVLTNILVATQPPEIDMAITAAAQSAASAAAAAQSAIAAAASAGGGGGGGTGVDGREVELQKNATHIQWRYKGQVTWTNLVLLADLKGAPGTDGAPGTPGTPGSNGADGRSVQVQASATHIQWRLVGDPTWINIVALSSLQGPQGIQGIQGIQGLKGDKGDKGDTGAASTVPGPKGDTGDTGPAGTTTWAGITGKPATFAPAAHGHAASDVAGLAAVATSGAYADLTGKPAPGAFVPHGGATGQVLTKNSAADADTIWATPAGGGGGGPADWSSITGKPAVIAAGADKAAARTAVDAVATTDPRLSDARTPTAHAHAVADVTGLQGLLDGKAATGHTHTAATTGAAGFMSAADKTKLDGVATGATAYTHPANHPASVITQDVNNRFVTDAEKAAWNAKAAGTHTHAIADVTGLQSALDGKADTGHTHAAATTGAAGFMSATDKTKLDGLSNYTHPTGDGNLHVPATGTTNSGKVLTAGAAAGSASWQSLPAAPVLSVSGKTGAVTLAKADVGLGSVDNTADLAKPISTATQAALDGKANTAETVFTLTGTTPVIAPANGTIQTWTLSANSAPTLGAWAAGEGVAVQVAYGTFTVSWPVAITWLTPSGLAPDPSKYAGKTLVIALYKIGSTVFGVGGQ